MKQNGKLLYIVSFGTTLTLFNQIIIRNKIINESDKKRGK